MTVGVGVAVGEIVGVDVGLAVGVGAQVRNKIEILLVSVWATARSCLPSPVKSPIAAERGPALAGKLMAALKWPVPSPNKSDTLFESVLAIARS